MRYIGTGGVYSGQQAHQFLQRSLQSLLLYLGFGSRLSLSFHRLCLPLTVRLVFAVSRGDVTGVCCDEVGEIDRALTTPFYCATLTTSVHGSRSAGLVSWKEGFTTSRTAPIFCCDWLPR